MDDTKKKTEKDSKEIFGYAGKMLRVDLTKEECTADVFEEEFLRKYIGGAAMGIKYIYDEVPPDVKWSDPENRLFLGSGPLGGTRIGGSGAIAAVSKGALTNGIASSQANGYFGKNLRGAGFDAIILQGSAQRWVYLYVHNGVSEFRDADHLVGKNNYEIDKIIKQELNKKTKEVSILSIGPGGENLVRFACLFTDMGHIAAHNGLGAVMGSKKLKAIVIEREKSPVILKDDKSLSNLAKDILSNALSERMSSGVSKEGTVGAVFELTKIGVVPVRNYTTSVHKIAPEKLEDYTAKNIRSKFNAKPTPCWACSYKHCHMMEISDGKYAGRIFEEPEYEGMAAFSSLVGIDDVTMTVVLASEVDRLGLDTNEAGWVISWLMECYDKGLITSEDTDGIEMTWGNGEAIMAMLNKIAYRKGFGDILAEGVMRAADHIGGEAKEFAIHTMKGNTPRSHDHRAMWIEMFDTIVSNTGTLEALIPSKFADMPKDFIPFGPSNPEIVSSLEAKTKGAMIFEDSLVTCRYQTACYMEYLCEAVNAATGWDMDIEECMDVGRRAVNLARIYNLRNGISPDLDAPSKRYGSTPHDGIAEGHGIMPYLNDMLKNYYRLMGWDEKGRPLPETLKSLNLDSVIPQLRSI